MPRAACRSSRCDDTHAIRTGESLMSGKTREDRVSCSPQGLTGLAADWRVIAEERRNAIAHSTGVHRIANELGLLTITSCDPDGTSHAHSSYLPALRIRVGLCWRVVPPRPPKFLSSRCPSRLHGLSAIRQGVDAAPNGLFC